MMHPLAWAVTALTFAFSLFALIDQTVLRRELSAQVFQIDSNGTAFLNQGVQKVILSPTRPSPAALSQMPAGSTFIGSSLRFGTGHRMDQDARGNLVLSVVVDGVQRRVATFSQAGAVGFGEIPLTLEQEATNQMYLTGSADSAVRDGWQTTGSMDIVHPDGTAMGKMCNVYKTDDPSVRGIQIYSDRAKNAITYTTMGQVFIGDVSSEFSQNNEKASVLVEGSVVVEDNSRQVNFKCLQIKSMPPPEERTLSISMMNSEASLSRWYNGNANDFFNTAYFDLNVCYSVNDIPVLHPFLTSTSGSVKATSTTCIAGMEEARLQYYTGTSCQNDGVDVSILLDTPLLLEGNLHVSARCWTPGSGGNISTITDIYSLD